MDLAVAETHVPSAKALGYFQSAFGNHGAVSKPATITYVEGLAPDRERQADRGDFFIYLDLARRTNNL